MSSSWELPDSPAPRRVVRSTVAPATTSKPASKRIAWPLFAVMGMLLLTGAAYGSYRIYLNRVDSRYEKHCRALREARQWRELKEVSLKWIAHNPTSIRGISYAGMGAERLSQYEEAVEILLKTPRNNPLSANSIANAAEIEFTVLNRPLDAIKHFEEVLKFPADPLTTRSRAESRQRMIFFYAMTMQRQKMTELIREAIKLGQETREHYVYLVGAEWLIFSNGPQANNLWRKSDIENEHFNVARALGVVANGYVTPEADARMLGDTAPQLQLSGSGIDPNTPEDRQGKEAHYDGILRAYLEKYPQNLELLSYFLARSTAAGDLDETGNLLKKLPTGAESDGRFWRYKASWQLMRARREKDEQKRFASISDAQNSLEKSIEFNPYDGTARHLLAGILRESGDLKRVERLEAISNEGSEIRRLVLQAPSAHVDEILFKRIKDYVAICGQSDIADAMARRLQLAPAEDFFPSPTLNP